MFRRVFIIALFFPAFVYSQVKECEPTKSYNNLVILDGIIVSVEKGDGFYICPGTDTKLSELSLELLGDQMKVQKVKGIKYENTPRIRIICESLRSLEAYSKSDIELSKLFETDSLTITLKSGSVFYGSFNIKYLEANISEGSLFKGDGYADYQDITVVSKATFSGFSLEGVNGVVRANSGGTAKVNISEEMDARVNTAGYIGYRGTPAINTKSGIGGKIVSDQGE